MTTITKKNIKPILIIAASAYILIWFIISQILKDYFVINQFDIALKYNEFFNNKYSSLFFLSWIVFLVPLLYLANIVVPIVNKFVKVPFFDLESYEHKIINFVFSSLNIAIIVLFVFRDASNIGYFLKINPATYIAFVILAALNVGQVFAFIKKLKSKNASYQEYLKYKTKTSGKSKFISIQSKLLISFTLAILLIIAFLSFFLMRDYKKTILDTVIANGTTLADQNASFINENIKIDKRGNLNKGFLIDYTSYLGKNEAKNSESKLKYESMSFYKKVSKKDIFMAEASTNKEFVGRELPEQFKDIESSQYVQDKKSKTYNIISPVFIGTKKIGFSLIVYSQNVILEPYFRTKVRILLFSVFVIYIAVILTYLIGGTIVLPLMYLQVNVRKIGTILSDMIKGKTKISSAALTYTDDVKTRDEIKTLSKQISEMVNVIKGIIPYISASTLKQADNAETTSSTTKDLTFLFTDIRGFTSLCEGKSPTEVVNVLNHYLDLQTKIILDNGGDIDKFVGDEVFAVFEGANKEQRACKAGMELRHVMAAEKERRTTLKDTTVDIGIGINTGKVVFGSVGAQERMDFTCIGDNVNIAARLEGANKAYKSKTLVSEAVYKKIEKNFICREIDFMTVKGKTKPIRIYEILQFKEKASKVVVDIKNIFEKGLALYRKQNWKEAAVAFKENIKKYNDGPSAVFLERCKLYNRNPPDDKWDGVFNLTAK